MNNRNYLPLFLTISAFVIFQACSGGGPNGGPGNFNPDQQQATSVETISATTADISQQIKSFGNIRAQEIVNVTPQVSNRITQIHADLGDTVQPGEPLAKIYDVPFRDQFQQAKAQLEQSRSAYVRDSLEFQRQQELYQKEVISSTEYDNARASFQNSKAQWQASRANLTQSREDLYNTEIRSPVYGVILTRNVSAGDLATTGQAAFEIANLTGYQCRVYLPFEEWRNVKIGQPVNFRVSNYPEVTGQGRVSQISPRLDPATGLGEVVISLTEQGQNIYQGVLVQATINVETHQNAVVIPRSALVENVQTLIEPESNTIQLQRSYSAFVVQGDSMAMRKELTLGIEQGDRVEILEGLQPGDEIVITGQSSLDDSTKVRVAGQQDFQGPEEIPIENTGQQDTSSASN
ncbi:efflux RND transporter periplasmic adaptor subunit [Aliifodinibius sp. S!AR15-10]|uniref:efflux RND transporter periplasmic adaptor subunit n=1 Tax=Aliifodinibius sp. S!AR15-10 TaxID=2950437 RepID=UPI002862CC79|nr:efflux RND transporter periplasmic adaptor subunit [Aliifodinibius sp. S!AR15-10]MDR8390796.1 efflux RND transporter periplasmic adaptor subunit [Aliifodinibius sp. S!AR15-10]